jgi:excisionase family DNA binding protein
MSIPTLSFAVEETAVKHTKPSQAPVRTVEETAHFLRTSRNHIFALMRTGQLGSYKIGRCRRIGQAHIDAYLATVDVTGGDAA